MTNSIGYLKKILLTISLLSCFFLFSTKIISAQETLFDTTSAFTHKVTEQSINTELTITLTSEKTHVLSLYTTSIQAKDITAQCFHINGASIKCKSYNRTSTTDVQLDLQNTIISAEKPLQIKILYSIPVENHIAYSLTSKVLDAKTTEVRVFYPKNKGAYSWVSENISSKALKGDSYEVIFKTPTKDSISIFFDKNVKYSFTINRVFNNTTEDQDQTFELLVPLDDDSQLVLWENIDPLPNSAIQDDDGNYIFKYYVKPNETITVKIAGYILKESSSEKEVPQQDYLSNSTGMWKIEDSGEIKRVGNFIKEKGLNIDPLMKDINNLNNSEKELFYKYLYQYVLYRLDTPKDAPLGIDNSARQGINEILKNSAKSSSMDYADFYIALLRNYSIPSKMVLGYVANIANSTTDGFYHYWVEYFDQKKQKWVSADPFLDEYLGNNLYGAELNDHISILKRGKSPMAPTLTFYEKNDFILKLDNDTNVEKKFSISSSLDFDTYDITKKYAKAYITTSNSGNVVISQIALLQSNMGNVKQYLDSVNNNSSMILLPKQTSNIQLNIPAEKIFFKKATITIRTSNNHGQAEDSVISDDIPENIPLYTRILAKILSLASFVMVMAILYAIYKLISKIKWTQH